MRKLGNKWHCYNLLMFSFSLPISVLFSPPSSSLFPSLYLSLYPYLSFFPSFFFLSACLSVYKTLLKTLQDSPPPSLSVPPLSVLSPFFFNSPSQYLWERENPSVRTSLRPSVCLSVFLFLSPSVFPPSFTPFYHPPLRFWDLCLRFFDELFHTFKIFPVSRNWYINRTWITEILISILVFNYWYLNMSKLIQYNGVNTCWLIDPQ